MMRFLNAKARITLGLVGLMISLTMLAFFLKIVPNKYAADVERRTAISETIAVYSTALVKTARVQRLKDDFELLATRNDDLLSLALRHTNGNLLVATGEHAELWQKMSGEFSTGSQVKVPIFSGNQKWGQLEIRFKPIIAKGIWGFFNRPIVQLVLFLGTSCFLIYYFYLGQVLRQLDPSQAVPGRVRSALDTMAEGLLILDRKEQIVLANQAFSTMVGKPADELIGFRAGELPWVDTENRQIEKSQRPWIASLAAGEVRRDRTVRLQLTDQSFRTFKTNCSPVLGEKGKYAGVLISFDDITELEQKEIELINSKLEAEEANKAKSSFLASMSHEIRTPMNAILGFTEILKRGYVKNEQESLKYLNTIHSSGKNLLELINDILDLSKVESGHFEVERLVVEPYSILCEVVQMLKVKADEKGLQLSLTAATEVPAKIHTDPGRLRQIAFNLIGNSIKFTEQGQVNVSCRYANDAGHSQLIIDIADTGIGMDETAQKNIFNPFVQADSTVTRRFGGTGLGLSISRKFAQALGGDISVQSEPGKGSVFSVSLATGDLNGVEFLPVERILELQEDQETADSKSWQLPGARVLIVDDGAENRELVQLLLEEAGVTVAQAENGQIGVDMALENDYDVILMDVNMPVMDGFTAAGILRQRDITIPIIALTANAMVGFETDCLAAGYSGYLSKPINIDQFMDKMTELLGASKVSAPQQVEPDKRQNQQPVESTPLVSTLPCGNEKFRNIILRFAERLDQQLQILTEAVQSADFEEIANLAHWLKGAGGTVGFDVFTEPAAQLEELARLKQLDALEPLLEHIKALAARICLTTEDAEEPSAHTVPSVSEASQPPLKQPSQQPLVSRLAKHQRLHKTIGKFAATLQSKIAAMDEAVQNEDYPEVAGLAHWLKGSAGTVGYDSFTQPATELEEHAMQQNLKKTQESFNIVKDMSLLVVTPDNDNEVRG